jgi:hypothetical protein
MIAFSAGYLIVLGSFFSAVSIIIYFIYCFIVKPLGIHNNNTLVIRFEDKTQQPKHSTIGWYLCQ